MSKKAAKKSEKKSNGNPENWEPLVAFRLPAKDKKEIEKVIKSGKHHSYENLTDFMRKAAKRELNSYKGNVKRLKGKKKANAA